MKYPDGNEIMIGDLVNHNCDRDVGTVVIIAETPSEIQAHGYSGPTLMIKCESKGLLAYGYEDIKNEPLSLIERA